VKIAPEDRILQTTYVDGQCDPQDQDKCLGQYPQHMDDEINEESMFALCSPSQAGGSPSSTAAKATMSRHAVISHLPELGTEESLKLREPCDTHRIRSTKDRLEYHNKANTARMAAKRLAHPRTRALCLWAFGLWKGSLRISTSRLAFL
jgi:hypothetical protein